jgi:hypothetical protein
MKHPNPTPKKTAAERYEEGVERLEHWRSLTPAEQRKDLDRRLGAGVGAKRQRAKLEGK